MKQTDIAYIAGLIDGEGYLGIKRKNPNPRRGYPNTTYQIRINIRMVDEAAIKFIKSIFGGSYYRERAYQKNRRPIYSYEITSMAAEQMIRSIIKYLRIKKDIAKLLLEFRQVQKDSIKYKTRFSQKKRHRSQSGHLCETTARKYTREFIEICEGYYAKCREMNQQGFWRGLSP